MKTCVFKHTKTTVLILAGFFIFSSWLLSQGLSILVLGQVGHVALIKNKDTKEVKAFGIGQYIFNSPYTLSAIYTDRLILKNANTNQELVIALKLQKEDQEGHRLDLVATGSTYREAGFERVSSDRKIEIKATREFVASIKKNLPNIVMEASSEVVPLPNGRVGVVLFNFEENSLFAKLGLKSTLDPNEASMITHINGQPISNAAQAIALMKSAENKSELNFTIVEGGTERSASIKIQ